MIETIKYIESYNNLYEQTLFDFAGFILYRYYKYTGTSIEDKFFSNTKFHSKRKD